MDAAVDPRLAFDNLLITVLVDGALCAKERLIGLPTRDDKSSSGHCRGRPLALNVVVLPSLWAADG